MLPAVLPLFPLSQVALFPHTFLPLHIFEPRYQELTREVLVSHQHFILALAKEPVTTDPNHHPPLHAAGSLARIVRAEPIPDGRWNLIVQGIGARRILEELPGRPYRQARHEPWPYAGDVPLEEAVRQRLHSTLLRYAREQSIEAPLRELLDLPMEEAARLNTLAMALEFDPMEKQFLLESPDLPALAERLEHLLVFALGDMGFGQGLIH